MKYTQSLSSLILFGDEIDHGFNQILTILDFLTRILTYNNISVSGKRVKVTLNVVFPFNHRSLFSSSFIHLEEKVIGSSIEDSSIFRVAREPAFSSISLVEFSISGLADTTMSLPDRLWKVTLAELRFDGLLESKKRYFQAIYYTHFKPCNHTVLDFINAIFVATELHCNIFPYISLSLCPSRHTTSI